MTLRREKKLALSNGHSGEAIKPSPVAGKRKNGGRRVFIRCVACRLSIWSILYFCLVLMWLCISSHPILCDYAPEEHTIGVNYGRVGDNLPASADAVKIITSLGIGRVRLFDPDATTLLALGGSGLQVVIGMGNDAIPPLATDAAAADQWVLQNVVPYAPSTNITTILLGNELFTDTSRAAIWLQLVPAIQNLRTSLLNRGLPSIKLSTAAELNTLAWSYPPSKGVFRSDIATSVLTPLFQFLHDTGSYFYINVYPYFGWRDDSSYIPIDYALFTRITPFITDGNLSYYNLMDAQLDAIAAAMEVLGFAAVRLAISETGWPTTGSAGQIGAGNMSNPQTYNSKMVDHVLSSPIKGTPRRPGIFIPTYIFALYNEDLKPGAEAERNWGILYANGTQVYPLDLMPSAYSSTTMTPSPIGVPIPSTGPVVNASVPSPGPVNSPEGSRAEGSRAAGDNRLHAIVLAICCLFSVLVLILGFKIS